MNLSVGRFAAVIAVTFALFVSALPPQPISEELSLPADSLVRYTVQRQLGRLRTQLWHVDLQLFSVAVKRKAERELRDVAGARSQALVLSSSLPRSYQSVLTAAHTAARAKLGTAVDARMLVLVDSARWYFPGVFWLEDSSGSRHSCTTVVRLRGFRWGGGPMAERASIHRNHQDLGPAFPRPRDFGLCSFEAQFGTPSPAVRRWLEDRGWQPIAAGYEPGGWFPPLVGEQYIFSGINYAIPSTAANVWIGAVHSRACTRGRLGACLDAVAPRVERSWRNDPHIPASFTVGARYEPGTDGNPQFMTQLAGSLGPARFAALWHSNEAVPDAYRRITGVSIDTLARRVLLGDSQSWYDRRRKLLVVSFPLVSVSFAALTLGLVVLSQSTPPGARRR